MSRAYFAKYAQKSNRNFWKAFFEGNKEMKNFWTIIKGLFFIPPTSFEILKAFFISTFREKFVNHRNDFDKFLSYLSKNYLNNSARFLPSTWSNFTSVADFQDYSNTTNPIESLNKVLKLRCTTGKINFYKACSIIHAFKVDSLRKFHSPLQFTVL